MEQLIRDLQHGARNLLRTKGFTFIAVLTLALGIGATTAIFSVVSSVLLRPLPYAEPDALVALHQASPERGIDASGFSADDLKDLEAGVPVEATAYFDRPGTVAVTFSAPDAEPIRVPAAYVDGDFFRTLGVQPALGREFRPDEQVPGSDRAVILSHALWRTRFNATPDVVGRTITIESEPFLVAGVMPPQFDFPTPEIGAWLPLSLLGENDVGPTVRDNRWLNAVARLAPGATAESAEREATAVASRLAAEYPATNGDWDRVAVTSLSEVLIGDARPALLVLLGAVVLVLIIACANLANLLLARGTGRSREIAVRQALGASRTRLIRQLLTETLLLALFGGLLGLGMAIWGVDALVALAADSLPRAHTVSVDAGVVVFGLGITVVTAMLFGLLPALRISRTPTSQMLREGDRAGTAGKERFAARNSIVIAETALAMLLLVGTGLMARSFWNLITIDPGFEAENVLSVGVSVPTDQLVTENDYEPAHRYREEMIRRLAAIPGVTAVGGAKTMPLAAGGEPLPFTLPGSDREVNAEGGTFMVTPQYFEALGIQLRRGRTFTDADRPGDIDGPVPIVVNEALARRLWPGEDPIGKSLAIGRSTASIVGEVGNVRSGGLSVDPPGAIYLPSRYSHRSSLKLFIRTTQEPARMMGAVRRELQAFAPDQPIGEMAALSQVVQRSVSQPRLFTALIAGFGGLALLLAVLGIYGVIAYTVAQRKREIGIRMALGQSRGSVTGMVVRQTLRLAGTGAAVGIVAALAGTGVLRSQLFGISPTDPLAFAATAVALLLAAAVAGLVPALRAARIDPMIAIRND